MASSDGPVENSAASKRMAARDRLQANAEYAVATTTAAAAAVKPNRVAATRRNRLLPGGRARSNNSSIVGGGSSLSSDRNDRVSFQRRGMLRWGRKLEST